MDALSPIGLSEWWRKRSSSIQLHAKDASASRRSIATQIATQRKGMASDDEGMEVWSSLEIPNEVLRRNTAKD